MQQYVLALGDHEYGVIIDLTSESDDLSANQKDLDRAPGSPAPIRGYNTFNCSSLVETYYLVNIIS